MILILQFPKDRFMRVNALARTLANRVTVYILMMAHTRPRKRRLIISLMNLVRILVIVLKPFVMNVSLSRVIMDEVPFKVKRLMSPLPRTLVANMMIASLKNWLDRMARASRWQTSHYYNLLQSCLVMDSWNGSSLYEENRLMIVSRN